jgi:hypothetical protein
MRGNDIGDVAIGTSEGSRKRKVERSPVRPATAVVVERFADRNLSLLSWS